MLKTRNVAHTLLLFVKIVILKYCIMKNRFPYLLISCFVLLISCSDGTQVADRIQTIIEERLKDKDPDNDIKEIILEVRDQRTNYPVSKITFDGQFLVIEERFINLGKTESFQVIENSIEIIL